MPAKLNRQPKPRPAAPAPVVVPPTAQASSVYSLSKLAEEGDDEKSGSVTMICGRVLKHKFGVGSKSEHDGIFIFTDDGEEFKLRRSEGNAFDDPELDKLVGKRICGKGMLHKHLFIVNEYSVVNLEKDEENSRRLLR